MSSKHAKADVVPVRQQNQYNCMTTSLCMALRALGVPDEECSIQQVNNVVGAMPLRGAAWEPLLAAASHYGMRATLTLPSTVRQLKKWTDAGSPIVIAWNPEGREWSHASLVFDVTEDEEHGFLVHVADPNIPDPDETVRVVPKAEFYGKWYEKSPKGFLIRRPACAIEREITPEGRQVMASSRWDFDDPRFQDRMDKALEEAMDLHDKWPSTPAREYVEYQRRGKKHPNHVAYEKARVKIWDKHLRGTGWAEDEVDREIENRFASVRKTAEAAEKKAADLSTEVFEGEMQPGDSDYQGDTAHYRDFADAVKQTRNWLGGKPEAEGWIERGKFHLDLVVEVESDDADEEMAVQRIQFVVDGVPSEKDIADAKRKFSPREWDVDVKTKHANTKTAEAADCWSDYKAGGLTRAELEECLKRFSDQEDSYEAEGRNRYRPRVRPSGPVNKGQLDALNSLLGKRPNDKFIKSLRDQVQQGRKLSEKQLKAVRQNLYRNSMKPLADHFRQASAKRVLARWCQTDKSAAEIKQIWTVNDPEDSDEIVDIVAQISNPRLLGDVIRGMGKRWDQNNPSLHDSQDSAEKDAMLRLEKLYGRDGIPDWVLEYKGDYRLASVKRLVRAYTKDSKVANRYQKSLDRKLKSFINRSFERIGLDGNGKFNTPQQGYSRAVDLMGEYGVELGEIPNSFDFKPRPTGVIRVDVAFTNQEDIFSPYEITNSMLVIQYTELREDVFEVIAYMS